jgi:hypothetical protein
VGGIAAAATVTAGASPGGVTITVTVPDLTSTTVTVPRVTTPRALSPGDAQRIRAAGDDPSQISTIQDAQTRKLLQAELRDLDAFLLVRPKLRPYRDHLWYVAHHSSPAMSPRRLAGLLWCTVWFPHDCG